VPSQPDLFGDARPQPAGDVVALARHLPPNIRFGTSTWTYDGWAGDVYHQPYRGPQPAKRLEEYARYPLFRTVGIDSAFYEPPSEAVLAAYASALPPGFPCVSKVWDRITAKRFNQDRRWGNLAGLRNPDFLNAELFKEAVLGPYTRAFRDHAGCFVFEFQAMRGKDVPDPGQWAAQLDTFLRALLRPGRAYADAVKLFEPYDRVREPLPELRQDLLRLIAEATRRRLEALILANNRAEGNAPGTLRAVAEAWANAANAPL